MRHAYACYGVSLQLGRLKLQRPAPRPGPHLKLGSLNRGAGATRLSLYFGVLHLLQAQILNPSTLNPSNFNLNPAATSPVAAPNLHHAFFFLGVFTL
jgi:hypothetical protein